MFWKTINLNKKLENVKLYSVAIVDVDFLIRFCLKFSSEEIDEILDNMLKFFEKVSSNTCFIQKSESDEFLLLFPDMSSDQTFQKMMEIKKKFRKEKFAQKIKKDISNVLMTFSSGIAEYPTHGETSKEVIRKATVALFQAKAFRRDRVCKAPVPSLSFNFPNRVLLNKKLSIEVILGEYGEIGVLSKDFEPNNVRFWEPQAICHDSKGYLYILDQNNHCVLKWDGKTISIVAGCGVYGYQGDNGLAANARLNKPTGIAVFNNILIITDTGNDVVRCVELNTGIITTCAGTGKAGYSGDGGNAVHAQLNKPGGAAIDSNLNIYINDIANNVIRKIDQGGSISTYAGSGEWGFSGDGGLAINASFNEIYGICSGNQPGDLFLADYFNHRIRFIDGKTGIISTVAGCGIEGYCGDGGDPLKAKIARPVAVFCNSAGDLFIAETGNSCIRYVSLREKRIYTIVGCGEYGIGKSGSVVQFQLANPNGVTLDKNNILYILDGSNNRVCQIKMNQMEEMYDKS